MGVLAVLSNTFVLWTLIGLIGTALAFAYYYGLLTPLSFNRDDSIGPLLVLYKPHTGPYPKIGAVFDDVEKLLAQRNINALFGVGLFFDSPREVKAEHLRSYAGFAVDPKSLEAAGTQEWMSSVGLMVKRIPATKAITCDFPFRSHWSFPLSAMRVYPASCKVRTFGEHFKGVASVEIYNPRPPLSKITFAFPQDNLEHFKIADKKRE